MKVGLILKQMEPQAEDPLQAAIDAMRSGTEAPAQPQETADPLAGAISSFRQRQPQEEPREIRRLRERLAGLREDLAEIPAAVEDLSQTRMTRFAEKLIALIQKAQRLLRDLDEQENGTAVSQLRVQATDLRDESRVRLYDIISNFLETVRMGRSAIRDARNYIESELPLSAEQKADLNALLDRREAALEAQSEPAETNPVFDFVSAPSEGVMLFINADAGLEDAAVAALQTEWMKIGEANRLFMENVFQTFVSCGGEGERAAVDALVDARSAAEASVESAGVAYTQIPPQRLEETGLVVPTDQNIIEVPRNVEVCDGHGTLSGGVSTVFVYTGEMEDAERPLNMEEFQESMLGALRDGLEQLVFDMRQAGYENATGAMPVDFQLYIGVDGRIRTVVATYEEQQEDVRQIYRDFAQHMANDISRQIMAPLYMQYYRVRVQFTFIDENRIFANIVN